jgi:hypothetical protein
MPTVRLSLSVPSDTWVGAVSRAYPDANFRVLTAMVSDATGYAVLEIGAASPLALLADIEDRSGVDRVDLLSASPDRTVLHIETGETSLLEPLTTAGIPLETPIRIEDGTVVWTFRTPDDRLSTLDSTLRAAGLEFEVESVRTDSPPEDPSSPDLTDRQAEVLATAFEAGYFEIPRGATVAEVADASGVSKSTASDVLRRAIRNLATWYLPADSVVGS